MRKLKHHKLSTLRIAPLMKITMLSYLMIISVSLTKEKALRKNSTNLKTKILLSQQEITLRSSSGTQRIEIGSQLPIKIR